MFSTRIYSAFATATLLLAAHSSAQSLAIDTAQTRSTGGVITSLDFEVTGSPRSDAVLLCSLSPNTGGLRLPGIGRLYLDISQPIFELGRIRLNNTGVGRLSFSMPAGSLDGMVLTAQAVVSSSPGTIQMTSWSGIGSATTPGDGPGGGVIVDYDHATGTLHTIVDGAPGDRVIVYHVGPSGHAVAVDWGSIGRSGHFDHTVGGVVVGPGEKIRVWVNGTVYDLDL